MAKYTTWRNSRRTWLKDVVPLDTPYNLHIDTSEVCNARCIYCGQSASPGAKIMSMELFEKIINDATEFPSKFKNVDLYYTGEPLCNPNLSNMIRLVKEADITNQIGITTNGLLLSPSRIDELIEAGLTTIRISIQALDEEMYRKICGVSIDFEDFVKTLTYLYRHKKECSVKMKIVDLAIKDISNGKEKFEEIFGSISDSIFVENVMPLYSEVDYDSLDINIRKRAKNGRYGLIQKGYHKVCYRPFIKLLVSTNGDVTAACCDHISGRDVVYGNIYQEKLTTIWNGQKHFDFMRMHLHGKRFQHMLCKDCIVPNDVSNEEDLLDPYLDDVLPRFEKC